MHPQRAERGRGRRAWLVALIGGNLAGLLYVIGTESTKARINLPVPAGMSEFGGTTPVVIVAALLGQFLLPAFLSGTTRRYTFWWGLVPIILYNGWAFAYTFTSAPSGDMGTFRLALLARVPLALLLSSGPVSLIRHLSSRSKRRQEAMERAALSQALSPQEGSWPPPPTSAAP